MEKESTNDMCHSCGYDAFAIAKDALSHQMPSQETVRRFNEIGRTAKWGIGILVTLALAGIGANWRINKGINEAAINEIKIILASEVKLLEKGIDQNASDIRELEAEFAKYITIK